MTFASFQGILEAPDEVDDWDNNNAWARLIEEEEKEEARKPLPATGHWMAPLQDYAAGDSLHIWFRFRLVEDKLEAETCDQDLEGLVGSIPEWYDQGEDDLSEIVNLDDDLDFALAHGLAPGQPFMVKIPPPKWERTSYEYDEWDCDYSWEVVKIMPLKAASAGARWQATLGRIQYFRAEKKRKEELFLQQSLDPRRWKVTQKKRRDYDTGRFDGFEMYLAAQVGTRPRHLAAGRGKDASLAFQALLQDFAKKHPQLDPAGVVNACVKSRLPEAIRINQWDRLRYEVSVL